MKSKEGIDLTDVKWTLNLCSYFIQNSAYYKAAYSNEETKKSLDYSNFLTAANGNFYECMILEWCKLFTDAKSPTYWGNILRGCSAEFFAGLLKHINMEEAEFKEYKNSIKIYRDKWVAHLDKNLQTIRPKMDFSLQAAKYYHGYVVKSYPFFSMPNSLEDHYKSLFDEAQKFYIIPK